MRMSKKLKNEMKRRAINSTLLIMATLLLVFVTINTINFLQKGKLMAEENEGKAQTLDDRMERTNSNNVPEMNLSMTNNAKSSSYRASNTLDANSVEMASTASTGHALYADGTVTSWGTNTYGTLGNGSTSGTAISYGEVNVIDSTGATITDATAIAASVYHVMVIREDGTVWAWGRNNYGQLGNRTTSTGVTAKAQQVKKSDGTVLDNIVKIETGIYSSYALDADGTIWSWGYNGNGRLGNGNTTNQTKGAIKVLRDDGTEFDNVKDIQRGEEFCVAITNDDKVYAWGKNNFGQFGNGTTSDSYHPIELDITDFKKVSVNYRNIGFLKNDGTVWTAGESTALGYDMGEEAYSTTFNPIRTSQTEVLKNVTDFEYSAASLYVTVSDNKYVYCCGDHAENADITLYMTPIRNYDGTYFEKDILRISRQTYDADFLIGTDGIVYTYGYNGSANMYKWDKVDRDYISIAGEVTERIRIERMLVGESLNLELADWELQKGINLFNFTINPDNFVYTMYDTDIATISNTGEVTAKKSGIAKGLVTNPESGYSMEIAIIVEDTYAQVETTGYSTVALDEAGNVWTWGADYQGSLAQGSIVTNYQTAITNSNETVRRVKTGTSTYLENIVKIETADVGALAIDKDGNVWGWGRNVNGQLGLNNTTNQSYAKLIYSGGDAIDISADGSSSTILLKDGSVYTAGYNGYSELSNSTTSGNVLRFTLAEKFEKIIKVENSTGAMSGLRMDGTLWTVGGGYFNDTDGYTESYIHGDGIKRTEGTTSPVQANLTNIVDFKASSFNIIAKDKNNDLYTWGSYYVGYDETTSKSIYDVYNKQTKVADNVDKIGIAYGSGYFTKLNETGLYSFGCNYYGELGRNVEGISRNLEVGKVQDGDGNIRTDKVIKIGRSRTNTLVYMTENGNTYGAGYNEIKLLGKREIPNYFYTTALQGTEKIRIDRTKVGDSLDLQITVDDLIEGFNLFNLEDSNFTYEIYPEYQAIATVDNNGIVTGISEGRARGKITDTANNLEVELIIEVEKNYTKIETTGYGTYEIDINGDVYFWGKDYYGVGGTGKTVVTSSSTASIYTEKQRVVNANDPTGYLTNVVDVISTSHFALALDKDGNVWSWGCNNVNQLGIGNVTTAYSKAQRVLVGAGVPLTGIVKMETTANTALALSKDGTVYTWGWAIDGNLINGLNKSSVYYATQVRSIDKVMEMDATCWTNMNVFLRSSGVVWTAGYKADNLDQKDGYGENGEINALSPKVTESNFTYPTRIDMINNVEHIVTNYASAAVIKKDGTVWTWGRYNFYEGDEYSESLVESIYLSKPVQVQGLSNVEKISANSIAYSAIMKGDNKIYTWGNNTWGECGVGYTSRKIGNITKSGVSNLGVVKTVKGNDFDASRIDKLSTSAADSVTYAILEDGSVYAYGANTPNATAHFQVREEYAYPYITYVGREYIHLDQRQERIEIGESLAITGTIENGENVYNKASTMGNLQLKSDDETIATVQGTNVIGVGVGSTVITVFDPVTELEAIVKVEVRNKDAVAMPQVELGECFTVVLKEDGTVWTSGRNTNSELGLGWTSGNTYEQAQVMTQVLGEYGVLEDVPLTNIVKISASYNHVLALSKDGEVYAWGQNTNGQLGINTKVKSDYAVKVLNSDGSDNLKDIIDVVAMGEASAFLDKDGYVLTCGSALNGKLGNGLAITSTTQTLLPKYINIDNVMDIDASTIQNQNTFMVALQADKKLYTWGKNDQGQLGNGTTTTISVPTKCYEGAISIEANAKNILIKDEEGKYLIVGTNNDAEFAPDTVQYTTVFTPLDLTLEDGSKIEAKKVELVPWGTVAIDGQGKAYIRGWNLYGNLAILNNEENIYSWNLMKKEDGTPITNVWSVARGGSDWNSAVITKDGTVWMTGDNSEGQIGDRTYDSTNYLTPFGVGYINLDKRNITIKADQTVPVNLLESEPDFNVFEKETRFDFEWSSCDEDIATVSQNGLITGKNVGKTMITVTAKNTGISASIIVNVTSNNDTSIAIPQVENGEHNTIVLKADGTVWMTGLNNYGQLGNGTTTKRNYFDQVKISSTVYLSNVIKISAGNDSFIALTADGEVYAWGRNNTGQLGVGTSTAYYKYATKVKGLYNKGYLSDIIDISMGYFNAAAVDKSGNVIVWGQNANGQLGIGNTTMYRYPVYSSIGNAISAEAGYYNMTILRDNRDLYQAGNYQYIGVKGATENITIPTKVLGNVVSYSEPVYNAIAKTGDGKIYAWGDNYEQALPIGNGIKVDDAGNWYTNTPTEIAIPVDEKGNKIDVRYVASSDRALFISTKDGYAYSCGYNEYGILSNGTTEKQTEFKPMLNSKDEPFKNILLLGRGKWYDTSIISKDGFVYTSGNNPNGEFGNNTNENANYLTISGTAFLDYEDSKLINLKVNENYNIDKNKFYMNGDFNVFPELNGLPGDIELELEDTDIISLDADGKVTGLKNGTGKVKVTEGISDLETYLTFRVTDKMVQIKQGYYFTLALKNNGTVWSWGYNAYGQLGNGNKKVQGVPVQTLNLSNVVDIGVGNYHSIALTEDGKVYTWGYNSYGQLGTGNTTQRMVPEPITGLSNIVEVEAYGNTSYAIDKYGKVYVWGYGFTKTPQVYNIGEKVLTGEGPMLITQSKYIYELSAKKYNWSVHDVIQVVKGNNHYLALGTEGEVYAWGNNAYGQLGRGWKANSTYGVDYVYSPDGQDILRDIVEIKAGNYSSIAVDKDGKVYTWGYNGYYQLGDGTNTVKTLPVQIEYLENIEGVSQSNSHCNMVYDYEGYVYSVGYGANWQLGRNTNKTSGRFIMLGDVQLSSELDRIAVEEGEEKDLNFVLSNTFNLKTDIASTENIDVTIVNEEVATLKDGKVVGKSQGKTLAVARHNASGNYKYIQIDVVAKDCFTAAKVENGKDFTIALKADGTVWSWGNNQYGQLGLGSTDYYTEPQQVHVIDPKTKEELKVVDIAVGEYHVIALAENGITYSWGKSDLYQTGQGTKTAVKSPTQMYDAYGNDCWGVVKVTAYKDSSYVIDIYGGIYACGKWWTSKIKNDVSPIEGAVDVTNEYVLDVDGKVYNWQDELTIDEPIKALSEGTSHSTFLSKTGKVYSIGTNTYGELGNGTKTDLTSRVTQVKIDENNILDNILEVKSGDYYNVAVAKDGSLYTWGINEDDKQGRDDYSYSTFAKKNDNVAKVLTASSGYHHTSIADKDGIVYAMGRGDWGQLGNRETNNYTLPVVVGDHIIRLSQNNIQVAVNQSVSLEAYVENFNILYDKTSKVTYSNQDTSVIKTTTAKETPDGKYETLVTGRKIGTTSILAKQVNGSKVGVVQVEVIPEDTEIKPQVSVGGSHTVSLRVDGTVWTWGQNTYGQLGTNDTDSRDDPVQVTFDGNAKIKMVSAGKDYSLALDTNGNVWGWGRNTNYEIGKINQTKVLKPRKIAEVEDIVSISAGTNTSVMLAKDGTIYTYGLNSDGQAGTGNYTAKVAGEANYDCLNVIDISAGSGHVMVLKSDGTVWVTGSNRYGQLGINDKFTSQVNIYQKVDLPETIVDIEARENSCFAISNTGNVYAWGGNYYGQLGLNDKDNRYAPEKVDTLSNIREIATGVNHTIARDGNGYSYVTGRNTQGELGVGNNTDKLIFDRVNTINTIMDISAGETYTAVALKDGSVWAWGDYNHGDTSLKSKTKSTIPVRIGSDNVSLSELEVTLKVDEIKLLDVSGDFVFNLIYDTQASGDFTYESLNNDIVTVDRDGNMRGMREGTTWVVAHDINNKRDLVAIVKVIGKENIVAPKVEAGNNFAVVLNANGTISTWGYNGQGQLGNGTMETSKVPTKTTAEGVYKDVKAGESFSLALKEDGTVWGFGSNTKGQLASTNISYNNRLMQINGLADITQIAAGKDYGLALDSYGILYGWGENSNGQLGQDNIGEYTYNVVRVAISTERITHIAAGNKQSAVVDSSGKVYGFGEFLNGYLPGMENAVKTEIGNGYMLVLTTDGRVYKYDGSQLVEINSNANVIDISVQNTENMYQTKDEKAYVWGTNITGALGVGNEAVVSTPTLAQEHSTSVFGIGAGYNNTYIISDEGFVYAAGANDFGEVGNASNDNSLEHTLVGDTEYEVKPESAILHIGDEEEFNITAQLFNVFREETKDLNQFEVVSDNELSVTAKIDNTGNEPKAVLNALSVGTANITIKDKETQIEKTIIRIVEPIEQDRIDFIKVNDIEAKVVAEKKYEVTIPTDDVTASLEVQTKDSTDAIDVGKSGIFAPNGNVTKVVEVNDRETIVTIDVKATNGEIVSYEVKIIKQSVNNDLEMLKVDETTITPNANGVYQLIVEDKESYEIYAKATSEYADVNIDGVKYDPKEQTKEIAFRDGEDIRTVIVNVRAESGEVKEYTVELYKKDAEEIRYLDRVMVNGEQAYKIAENKYYAIIGDTDNKALIEAYAKFYTSSVDIEGNGYNVAYNTYEKQINDLETEVIITVKDQFGKTKQYTLVIVKETVAKQELQLEFVRVNGIEASISEDDNRVYEITFDKPVTVASIEAGTVLDDANVSINGGAYKLKVSTENITITANYIQVPIIAERENITTIYYLNIYGLPDETDLKTVSLQGVGDATYNPVTQQYEISVTKDITDYIVEVEPADSKSSTKIEDDEYVVGNSTKTIVKADGETITEVKIYCQSQSGLAEKEYTLVIREKSNNNSLNAILVNDENATYDEDAGIYYKEVSGDTNLANIKVLPEEDNVLIEIEAVAENPHEVAINDRETIVTIKVTAEDGSEATYQLKIVRLSNNTDCTVEAGQTVDSLVELVSDDEGNYYVKVPRIDTYVVKVTVPTDAKLSIDGNDETTGTETIMLEDDVTEVSVTITAEDGTEVNRIITIEKESDNKEIESITGEHILSSKIVGENMYEIKLDDIITDTFDVTIEAKHDLANVKLTTEDDTNYEVKKITRTIDLADCVGTDEEGNEILTFQVDIKAEDGSVLTYTIMITKVHNLSLDKVEVNGIQADIDGSTYNVVIPRTNDENIKITAKNEDVIITLYEDGLALGENPGVLEVSTTLLDEQRTYMIVVKDPNDDTRTEVYTLNVRKQSNKAELVKVTVDGTEVQADEDGIYKVSVKDLQKHVLELISSDYSTIKVDTENYNTSNKETKEYAINPSDTKTITVKVKAEDGTESAEYTIEIYVMDNDNTFELKVDNTVVTNYDADTKTYKVEVENTNTQAVVEMIANSNKAIVSMDDDTDNASQITRTKALSGQGTVTKIKLEISSEDGETETRYLEITQLSNKVMLESITVNQIVATKVDDTNYEVTIGDSTGLADIVIKALDSTSYIIVDNDEANKAQGTKTEQRSVQNGDKIVATIRVMADNGDYKDYTLTINVISSATDILEITVDDEEVETVEPNTYRYFIAKDATSANVHVKVEEGAQIEYAGNTFAEVMDTTVTLTGDVTEIKFKVIAEDGTEEENTLYIYKISEDNGLLHLFVDGTEVISNDGVNYRVEVSEDTQKVMIKAETKNEFAEIKIGNTPTKVNISEIEQTLANTKETTVRIEVFAQNGDVENYTLVIAKISDNNNINEILVDQKEPEFRSDENLYYIVVSDEAEHEVYMKAEDAKATIGINSETGAGSITTKVTFAEGEYGKLLPYTITSESGKVKTGNLLIVRSSTEAGVKEVKVNSKTVEPTSFESKEVYIQTIPDDALSADITVIPTNLYATVKIGTANAGTGETTSTVNMTLDQLEITIPVVITATDGTTTETFNVILRRESYKPETGIKGVIYTENVNAIHNATISVYKSLNDGTNNVGTDLVGTYTTNNDGTYKATIYQAPKNKSDINDKNANGIADELECKYDIVITKSGYLSYTILNVELTEGEFVDLGEYKLLAGDVVETGEIQIDDLVKMNDNFGEIITNENGKSIYDLNEDGQIDKQDRDILKKNYGKKAEVIKWVKPVQTSLEVEQYSMKKQSASNENETDFILPIKCKYTITSEYGTRTHPVTGEVKKHTGIDLAGTHHTEVYAVADGEVIFAGVQNAYGNCIEIKHKVNGETIYSFYAHLSQINVQKGDKVSQGTIIGLEGGDPETDPNPGSSTGHHLHFELRNASGYGNDVNPNDYINFNVQ